MKISTTSEDTYPTLTTTYTTLCNNAYDLFIDSLSYYKTRAINAAYDNGYLTEEEAKQLKEEGCTQRNDFSCITIDETSTTVEICCLETAFSHIEILFSLSYDKTIGVITNIAN